MQDITKRAKRYLKRHWMAHLMVLPLFVGICIFSVYPPVQGMIISFFDVYKVTDGLNEFIGLKNFKDLFQDIAVKNTCINTGGITTESINSSSSQLPTWYIRVERNCVYGVSHGIEQGIENKLSSSYNTLDFRSGIRCRIDQSYIHGDRLLNSITFKDNEAEHVNKITAYGKEIGFAGVLYVGQSGNASIKNIIIERNNIHDTNNTGIYVGENVADCVVSDNKVYNTSAEQETNIVSSNITI